MPTLRLDDVYGEDIATALYQWRLGGVSFGLERRFWWTLLASAFAGAITACGVLIFRLISQGFEEVWWLTDELKQGLVYDGSTVVPANVTAFAAWGSGRWEWVAHSVWGGLILSGLKMIATVVSIALAPGRCGRGAEGGAPDVMAAKRHTRSPVYPRLTPNLVFEAGALHGHVVHGFMTLLCGAVSVGVGASLGPEAPIGAFGAGVGAGLYRLFTLDLSSVLHRVRPPPPAAKSLEVRAR